MDRDNHLWIVIRVGLRPGGERKSPAKAYLTTGMFSRNESRDEASKAPIFSAREWCLKALPVTHKASLGNQLSASTSNI